MKVLTLILMVLATLSQGCATLRNSILTGAALGATTGAIAGNAIGTANNNTQNGTIIGAASGLALGGLIGYIAHRSSQPKEQVATQVDPKSKVPSLSAPEVRRVWVPARIDGDKYIEGHFEFIIERRSVWTDQ